MNKWEFAYVVGCFSFLMVIVTATYLNGVSNIEKNALTSEIVFGAPVMTTTFKKQDRLPQTCP